MTWLQGHWESKGEEATLYENWEIDADNRLHANNYALSDDKDTTFKERIHIVPKGDDIYFSISIGKTDTTDFRMVKSEEKEMVFEDLTRDFPQRIIYQNKGKDSLYARIEGYIDGKLQKEEFFYRRRDN